MNCLKNPRTHARILIFMGVMGGLMTPLLSEAGTPIVRIQVDSSSFVPVGVTPCAVPSGYTACWALSTTGGPYPGMSPTGETRSFVIRGYAGLPPRLLIVDTNGSGLDGVTLTTLELDPSGTAPVSWGDAKHNTGDGIVGSLYRYGEKHTLKIEVTHKFDQKPNPKTVGTTARYSFALRTSGMFKGSPTGATASGDFVKFEGKGIFGASTTTQTTLLGPNPGVACDLYNSRSSPLDVNYCPLKRTMGVTTSLTSSFSTGPTLQQGQPLPYPNYFCDNGAGSCTPTVILTMTATINGPDSFILPSSNDAVGGSCNLDPMGPPTATQAIPCHSQKDSKKTPLDNMISDYFKEQTKSDEMAFLRENAVYTPACTGDECVCQDPDVCGGSITITKNVTWTNIENCPSDGEGGPPTCPSPVNVDFSVSGPSSSTPQVVVTIPPNFPEGGATGNNSVTIPVATGDYTVTETNISDDRLFLQSITGPCSSGTPFNVSPGSNVTCTFNNSDQIFLP
jgi:hypothetical protein